MLGVTSYQDALRALGGILDGERGAVGGKLQDTDPAHLALLPGSLDIVEDPGNAEVVIRLDDEERVIHAARLQQVAHSRRALRGASGATGGPLSDLLRAIGAALDDL